MNYHLLDIEFEDHKVHDLENQICEKILRDLIDLKINFKYIGKSVDLLDLFPVMRGPWSSFSSPIQPLLAPKMAKISPKSTSKNLSKNQFFSIFKHF